MASKKSKKPAKAARKTTARKAAAKSPARKPAKKATMRASSKSTGPATSRIDDRIKDLGDWRGRVLAKVRQIIQQADPEIVEEWKWVKPTNPGVPVWSHNGIICTGETYKDKVKLTFAKGAALKDPANLFNSSLDGNVRRAIDIYQSDDIDEAALKNLIREAIALNFTSLASRRRAKR